MKSRFDRLEVAAGILLSGLAIYLRVIALISAGALWRDEANTVGLATLPRLRDVWSNLQFDSFPMLWLLIVRTFSSVAGAYNDSAFRWLGFVIGLALIAALWINARAFGYRVPLMALALFATSPSVIVWGDSMRAYGLAMVLIFVTATLIWRFVEKPSAPRFTFAVIVAVLSVQTVYYNAVVLVALCAGGVAVCCLGRRWKAAAAVIAIGAIAALSLVPYAATIRSASAWTFLVRIPDYTVEWFFVKLYECLVPGGSWTFTVWVIGAFAGAISATVAVLRPAWFELGNKEREVILFALASLVIGTIGSFLFLRELSYYTQPWYYLTLLTIVAFSLDALAGTVRVREKRILRLVFVLTIGGGTFFVGRNAVAERLTNADLVAATITQNAKSGDVVIVNPWYYGVSFDRYYRGPAPGRTVPDIPFHRFHRYDLVMAAAHKVDSAPVENVIVAADSALEHGGTVFVVGTLSPRPTHAGSSVPVAGDQAIQNRWMELVRNSFTNADTISELRVPTTTRVSRYENLRIFAVRRRRNPPIVPAHFFLDVFLRGLRSP